MTNTTFNKALAHEFGKRILRARIDNELLQRDIAGFVALPRGCVSNWEHGRRLIGPKEWKRLRAPLGLPEYDTIREQVARELNQTAPADVAPTEAVTQ